MRLTAILLFGLAIAGLGFWLATTAISLMGAWMAGFAMGAFLAAFAVTHKQDENFRREIIELIRKL